MLTKEIEHLTQITHKDYVATFADLLDYTLWAFGVPIPAAWQYTQDDTKHFLAALRKLIDEYAHGINLHGWCDPLGGTFMQLISGNAKYRGQYFTPEGLCTLMADTNINPAADAPRQLCGVYGRRIIVSDPTCGSGRNLLAVKAKYEHQSEEAQPYFVGEDIDTLCCKMTAINMCVHGCYGEVLCHDTLTQPDKLRFGYLININLRYTGHPSIFESDNPMMFETTSRLAHKETLAHHPVPVTRNTINQARNSKNKTTSIHPVQLDLFAGM